VGTGQGRLGRTGQRYQKLDFDKPCELSLEFGIYSKLWKGFKQKNNRITFLRKFILKKKTRINKRKKKKKESSF